MPDAGLLVRNQPVVLQVPFGGPAIKIGDQGLDLPPDHQVGADGALPDLDLLSRLQEADHGGT